MELFAQFCVILEHFSRNSNKFSTNFHGMVYKKKCIYTYLCNLRVPTYIKKFSQNTLIELFIIGTKLQKIHKI